MNQRYPEDPDVLNALDDYGYRYNPLDHPEEDLIRLYNASTRDRDPEGYIDPHVSDWVKEVAAGASEIDWEEITTPLVYLSDKLDWIFAIVGRKIKKYVGDVTYDDIRQHGRLNIIDVEIDAPIYKVGDYWETEELTDLAGNRKKFWMTELYSSGDVYTGEGQLEYLPCGPEPEDFITNEAVEVTYSLVGDELVDFLQSHDAGHPAER